MKVGMESWNGYHQFTLCIEYHLVIDFMGLSSLLLYEHPTKPHWIYGLSVPEKRLPLKPAK